MKTIRLTENAVKNHAELFPNHESKLQKTDPEFIALFDNWAFDEVIRQSQLDAKTRVMIILASTIASQVLGEYKVTPANREQEKPDRNRGGLTYAATGRGGASGEWGGRAW